MPKSITILKLKLQLSDEDKRSLHEAAVLCRKARNVGVENWLLRQRGLPLSDKQSTPPQVRRVKNKTTGKFEIRERTESTETTKIYHAMTEAVPELDSGLVSQLSRDVHSLLNAKVDWRKRGDDKTRRRSDDVLDYSQRPPFSQSLMIPVLNRKASFVYGSQTSLTFRVQRKEFAAPIKLDVLTARLGSRVKSKLIDIFDGTRKLRDSHLRFREEKNSWYWYLPVDEDEADPLDPEVTLELRPTWEDLERKGDPAFRIGSWYVGDGRYLRSMLHRIYVAEKEIGLAYRNRRTGAGHGRKKKDKAIAIKRRQRQHQLEEYRRKLICDIVRQCDRHGAGTIVYREPTLPLRQRSWFGRHGIDWDWTRFHNDLKNAAIRAGVVVQKKALKLREEFPKEKEQETVSSEPHAVE